MPALYAEIQVAGHCEPLDTFTFSLYQSTDYTGRPSSRVRVKPINLTLTGQAAMLTFFKEWAVDDYLRRSGQIVVYEDDHITWRLTFYDAWCILHETDFGKHRPGEASYQVTLELSPAAVDVDGSFIELHSDIWWEKKRATRFNALTKPADPLPSPRLRATLSPVASPQDPTPTASSKPSKPYKNKKKLLGDGDGPSKKESLRLQYLGRTPGKASLTGQEVIKRMESEGKIREADPPPGKEVLGPDGNWYALQKTDMGHLEDAVTWWNTEGRKHSPKGKEVRKWMLDSTNYELEPSSINRSRGAKLKQTYLPPLE